MSPSPWNNRKTIRARCFPKGAPGRGERDSLRFYSPHGRWCRRSDNRRRAPSRRRTDWLFRRDRPNDRSSAEAAPPGPPWRGEARSKPSPSRPASEESDWQYGSRRSFPPPPSLRPPPNRQSPRRKENRFRRHRASPEADSSAHPTPISSRSPAGAASPPTESPGQSDRRGGPEHPAEGAGSRSGVRSASPFGLNKRAGHGRKDATC